MKTEMMIDRPLPAVVITRTLKAPREVVWQAWTDPKQLAQWWGPHCFSNPRCEADVRPGGRIHIDMMGPDGTVYPMGGHFDEVQAPERLVFTTVPFMDAEGNVLMKNTNTITFEDLGDGTTRLTVESRVLIMAPEAAGAAAGMEAGWSQSLEKLDMLITKR